MKKAVLAVSFGTSVEEARQKQILPVEEALRASSGLPVYAAYTSPTIRRVLEGRGISVPGVASALLRMREDGVTAAIVQPTHILYGYEYDKLAEEARRHAPLFHELTVGEPLLASAADLQAIAALLDGAYPANAHTSVVLLGHGTAHFANMAYPALQTAFRLMGRGDILVGTAKGWPGFGDVLAQLCGRGARDVRLVPLMLVAGGHAQNDMAGPGRDSWESRLLAEGYSVSCAWEGLGSLRGVQRMYSSHLAELLNAQGRGARIG